jgi:hypothetical protein
MSTATPEKRWRDRLSPPPSAPNVVVVLVDESRLRRCGLLRRRDRYAERRCACRRRPSIHELPRDTAVLTESRRVADGSQPARGRSAALDNDVLPLADSLRPHSVWQAPVRPAPTRLVPGSPTLGKVLSNSLIKHRSFRIDVRVEHGPGAEGTLVAHGDQGGGYALYLVDDCPVFVFNAYGEMSTIAVDARLDASARRLPVPRAADRRHLRPAAGCPGC